MLDPSCGDGRFIAAHSNSVGVEQDPDAALVASKMAPSAVVHQKDFFTWAETTPERFDCAAGNPPFIRYQSFAGDQRRRALSLCRNLGADFNGLTSSWAPFIVAVTGLLKLDGRMAFVVPAEIGHAPYAAPVLEHLVSCFRRVQIVAVRDKLFPELSEDCWLLYAEGHGGTAREIEFTVCDSFQPGSAPPKSSSRIPVGDWRKIWNRRLRPFLMPENARNLYQLMSVDDGSFRLREAATVGIGYVSGANDFFHLRPSDARNLGISDDHLMPSVRNGRALSASELTEDDVKSWRDADLPVLLLRLQKGAVPPPAVARYLDSSDGFEARKAFKCRSREPWWSVPDVRVPDYFLSYMSGVAPNLVRNSAGVSCTNSVHAVRATDHDRMTRASALWTSPFVRLSCEVEGHPLGGGMLKLEVREAGRVLLPSQEIQSLVDADTVNDALLTMRLWRHCA
jgi:hypothetical protein